MGVRPGWVPWVEDHGDDFARLALAATILGGLLTIAFYALFRPSPANTFGVFYAAAQSALAGRIVFKTTYGLFVYTPITVVFFVPYAALLDLRTAVLVQRLLSIVVALGYGVVLFRFIRSKRSLSRLDEWLIIACMTVGLYPVVVGVLAGIEIYLACLLGIGFILLESSDSREAYGGALWAVASLFKVFPALWGVYLVGTRRWRAIGGAFVTGVAATLVGILIFGINTYLRYIQVVLHGRVRIQLFEHGASPDNEMVTPVRPLSQLFPRLDPHVWVPLIAVVVVTALVYVYLKTPQDGLDDRVALLLFTVIAVEFVMPTSQDLDMYLLYGPLIMALYLERDALVRAGLALSMVVFTYNFGRKEVDAVFSVFGPTVHGLVMTVANPVLAFASMPLYGMLGMFVVLLFRVGRH